MQSYDPLSTSLYRHKWKSNKYQDDNLNQFFFSILAAILSFVFAGNAERHWMTSHPILFSSFDYNTIKSSGTTNIRVIIPQGRNQNLSI